MPIASLSTKFVFQSKALEPDTFRVLDFEGEEEISRLSRFEINLSSDLPDVDLQAVLEKPAFLGVERDGELRKIHGIVSEFEQREQDAVHVHYRAVLVPRLWKLTLRQQNQVHQEQTIGEIIEQELKDAGFTNQDYEIKLQESHPKREYVVQYQESDFAFLSRLAEHEGIFFYFVHDEERDKVVFADKNEKFTEIDGDLEVLYRPPVGVAESDKESVLSLVCRQRRVPKEVVLKDYNWRTPSLDLTVKSTVDSKGEGLFCEYGDHYKDKDKEGAALAKLRAEEIRCRQTLFFGEANVLRFRTGHRFKLDGHYRSDFNQELLLHQVSHSGSQVGAGHGAVSSKQAERPIYRNQFVCGSADVPFRPERLTPRPRILGTINARVDAGGSGQYAELDDQGRYKVALPLDQKVDDLGSMSKGKGSRWVRFSQPYAGPDCGIHNPLHKGTEVLLTHIDGDPDRPIICGSVPNPENKSPVTSSTQTQSIFRDHGGNETIIDRTDGKQFIHTKQKCGNEFKIDGSSGGEKIELRDKYGNEVILDAVAGTITIHSPTHESSIVLGKSIEIKSLSDLKQMFQGNYHGDIFGKAEFKVGGDFMKVFVGAEHQTVLGSTSKLISPHKAEVIGGWENKVVAGRKSEFIKGSVVKGHWGTEFKMGKANQADKAPFLIRNVGKAYYGVKGMICQKMANWRTECEGRAFTKAQEIFQDLSGDMDVRCAMRKMTGNEAYEEFETMMMKAGEWKVAADNAKVNAKMDVKNGTLQVK